MNYHHIIKICLYVVLLAFSVQAFAACPRNYTRDSSSGLCVRSACAGKCTYYYNDTTYDFEAKVNSEVAPGTPVVMDSILAAYIGEPLHNATIGEGITGFSGYVFLNNPIDPAKGKGTLTLPSTFKQNDTFSYIHTGTFDTYDLSALKNTNLTIGSPSSYNIILGDDANIRISTYCPYGSCAPEINMMCKGNQVDCRNQLKSIAGSSQVTTSYYSGLTKDGNWEVYSDEGKAIYADSSMQKLLSKYDFDGNQTGLYEYDRGGNLVKAIENGVEIYRRRIYTPAEATAAVSGKNTFKIQYR